MGAQMGFLNTMAAGHKKWTLPRTDSINDSRTALKYKIGPLISSIIHQKGCQPRVFMTFFMYSIDQHECKWADMEVRLMGLIPEESVHE